MVHSFERSPIGRHDGAVWRGLVVALLVTAVLVAPRSPLATPAAARPQDFVEYPLPTDTVPTTLTTGADGNVWFTNTVRNEISRITPTGSVTEFAVPDTPFAITAGPDGNLWFVEQLANAIGRLGLDGTVTEFPIPTASANPQGMTAGPDGNVWFTEIFANQVGRITPDGTITEFPTPPGTLFGIANGPDGNLWYGATGAVGRLNPADQTVTVFPLASGFAEHLTAGPDGNVWFTNPSTSGLGKITPDGTITEFPLVDGSIGSVTGGPDGNVWFTEPAANRVGKITPGGIVHVFDVPTPDANPNAITSGPDGRMWFTEGGIQKVAAVVTTAVPAPVVSGIAPTSGPSDTNIPVTITGTGFTGASAVSFGTTPASGYTVVDDSRIDATSPKLAGGVYDVTVTTPAGVTAAVPVSVFTSVAPVTVIGITPAEADPAGGLLVTITGTGFTTATSVLFGDAVSNLDGFFDSIDSDTQISVAVPPHDEGVVDVRVVTPDATSPASAGDKFTYKPLPTVAEMIPAYAPAEGGSPTTVDGTRLTGATAVTFGDITLPCPDKCTVLSDTQIVVVAPPHPVGTVDVTVTTPVGTSVPGAPAVDQGGETMFGRANFAYYGEGSFRPSGNCVTPEQGCYSGQSVRLEDGRVLEVGGADPAAADVATTTEAQLYDPRTEKWTPTTSYKGSPNLGFTLTKLASGTCGPGCAKVLFSGGGVSGGDSAAAALYNPADETWQDVGAMTCARGMHTATLLTDGRVLVAGGYVDNSGPGCEGYASDTAELFDPGTGMWTPAGNMHGGHVGGTATLLVDGRVLVAGGLQGYFVPSSRAETFDPATGEWTEVGSLGQPRLNTTSTLLPDGKVLVAGGTIAAYSHTPATKSAELFDPATGQWSPTGSMAFDRGGHQAALMSNGRVLVLGGDSGGQDFGYPGYQYHGNHPSLGEVYDPVTGVWAPAAPSLDLGPVGIENAGIAVNVTALANGNATECGKACGQVLVTRSLTSYPTITTQPWSMLYQPVAVAPPVSPPPVSPPPGSSTPGPYTAPSASLADVAGTAASASLADVAGTAAAGASGQDRQGAGTGRIPATGANISAEVAWAERLLGLGMALWGFGLARSPRRRDRVGWHVTSA